MRYFKILLFVCCMMLMCGCAANNESKAAIKLASNITEKEVFDKICDVKIVSSDEVDSKIPIKTTFDLKFDKDVTDEYVYNTFSLKPRTEIEITKVDSKNYKITPVTDLEEDQVYNVIEKTTDGTKRWAFQTERIFEVDYTYPDNNQVLGEKGVPEISFNGEVNVEDLSKYVEIEPKVNGKWVKSYTYNYRFEHNTNFTMGKTYTVTVKKGLKDVDGNELREDYKYSFLVANEKSEDVYGTLLLLNRYTPTSKIDLSLNLYIDMDKELSLKKAEVKIFNVKTKENFLKLMKEIDLGENLTNTYDTKSYNEVYKKDIKSEIMNRYAEAKKTKRYYYSDEISVESNLTLKEEGYYLAVLTLNDDTEVALFQINNTVATVSTLADDNFMILYKGKDGNNNSVDVYLNNQKLGTTSNDGMLYLEEFRKIVNLEDEFNYIEFDGGNKHYIVDISYQVYSKFNGENSLTSLSRFNNGYLYVDRNTYKVGETAHFWGYARNRKVKVDNATLKIISNYDDVLQEIPLTLTDVGTFETDFEITDVNDEGSLQARLYIGDKQIYSRYISIRNYELKQYQIEIKPEKTSYLTGEEGVINITAATYDGTPLTDLDFEYEINNKYYYNDSMKPQKGTVKTDASGNAVVKVPLVIAKEKTNLRPETARVTILNSYIDGEQETFTFTVYPYKHSADGGARFIVDENKYHFEFNEYLSLDRTKPANDKIKVVASAYKTVRTVTGQRYNKYTKEMEDVVRYDQVAEPSYNKTFIVDMKNGKGTYKLENYKKDKNCYYTFKAYLITDTGKELALGYDGGIYSYSYKTVNSTTQYEEIEYVAPIINDELSYAIAYERNDKLKVGDEVKFYLKDDHGRRINDYSKFDFYTLVVSADGNKIYHNKGEAPHFTFTKEMGANASTYTLLYDSRKTYSPTSNVGIYYSMFAFDDYMWYPYSPTISLCEEALTLDLSVTLDKEVYEPKDEMIVKIKATSDGKGVKTGINLSALDTAYIDANGSVYTDMISTLQNAYRINSSSNSMRVMTKEMGIMNLTDSVNFAAGAVMEEAALDMAESSSEGSTVRDDLRVTAFFENVVTDENGEATIKIKLPDNITEWTITVQAISDDYKVKEDEKKIKVSKDFFVNVNHKDRYLVGENFGFNIKSFSKLYSGKDVKFDIEILNENNETLEKDTVNAKVAQVLSYKIKKPIKEKGTYKIKITGTCNGLKDTLIDEIEVTESLLDATMRKDIILHSGDKITIVSPKGYLYLVNTDLKEVLPTIFELSYLFNAERNDTSLISKEASRILGNLYNGTEFDYSKSYMYDANTRLFKVLKNSSDDARLALRMLGTKSVRISDYEKEKVLEKIEVRLGDEAVLWAKVNLDDVSLKELREAKEEMLKNKGAFTKERVLYLALAFADLGSYDDAKEIYDIVSNTITEKEEIEFELKTILAIKLNLNERNDLYRTFMAKESLPEHSDFIKLYYVQNAVSKNYKKGVLKLNVNGNIEEVEVKGIGFKRVLLARKNDIAVDSITNNLSVMLEEYKPVDFTTVPKNKYIISKTYSNTNAKEGDIVEVSITIDNKKLYDDGNKYSAIIEDAIPNNMTFVEYLYGTGFCGYLRSQNGQKLTISYWNPYDPKWSPNETKTVLTYRARVTNNGEQFEPGTILLKTNNQVIDGLKK